MQRWLRYVTLGAGVALGYNMIRRLSAWDFAGRVVVITGGTRGLGLCIARELGRRGAAVVLLGRNDAELQRAIASLRAMDIAATGHRCDVTKRQELDAAIRDTVHAHGRLDMVVNNAGVIQVSPFGDLAVADFEAAMAVHVYGPLYATLAALPVMREQGFGRIVNIASVGGKVAVPHLAAYCASKFALVGLSRAMHAELAADNVQVTCVCPGLMRTGSHRQAFFKGQHDREYTWFTTLGTNPLASVSAKRAARHVVDAASRGDAHVVISPQARLLTLADALAPELVAQVTALAATWLPNATAADDSQRRGADCSLAGVPTWAIALGERAAAANNEVP